MIRARTAASFTAAFALAACNHAPPRSQAIVPAASRVALDSAEIARLCAHPDSVRAGLADCVLKDQSARGEKRLESPPAPPR